MNAHALPIHPAADMLPRLTDDELADLAADIGENGQRDPVVAWTDETGKRWLLDGRNRLAACRIAGVEPRIAEATVEKIPQPFAFVISKNLNRRHLSKGQIAVALALLEPEGKRGRPAQEKIGSECRISGCGVSPRLLSEARRTLRENRTLALDVLAGREPVGRLYHEPGESTAVERESAPRRAFTETQRNAARVVRESHRRKASPPVPPDELNRTGTRDTEDPQLKRAIAAFGMLAGLSAECDAFALVQKHGDPHAWRYFNRARQFIRDLEDSV